MSMIQCKECGKEISDAAKVCPNCGAPNKKEKSNKNWSDYVVYIKKNWKLFSAILGGIFVLIIILLFIDMANKTDIPIDKLTRGMSREEVEKLLGKPSREDEYDSDELILCYENRKFCGETVELKISFRLYKNGPELNYMWVDKDYSELLYGDKNYRSKAIKLYKKIVKYIDKNHTRIDESGGENSGTTEWEEEIRVSWWSEKGSDFAHVRFTYGLR